MEEELIEITYRPYRKPYVYSGDNYYYGIPAKDSFVKPEGLKYYTNEKLEEGRKYYGNLSLPDFNRIHKLKLEVMAKNPQIMGVGVPKKDTDVE